MSDDDLIGRLKDAAKKRGVSVDALVREMLRGDELARAEPADVELSEDDRLASLGAPPPDRWTDHEAAEAWFQSERQARGGVHSPGGMTAGGIFGDAPIPTETYDPLSDERLVRTSQAISSVDREERTLRLLELTAKRLERLEQNDEERRQLSGRQGRR